MLMALKWAVTLLSEFIVMVVGFVFPERSPLQWSKAYSKELVGAAVSITTVPEGRLPPGGIT